MQKAVIATLWGVLSAILSIGCCGGALWFLAFGVAAQWFSVLEPLGEYRWIFVSLSLVSIAYGGYLLYFAKTPRCHDPKVKLLFWLGSFLTLAIIAAPFVIGA